MPSPFHIVRAAADRGRKDRLDPRRTIHPKHEDPPHGDVPFPYIPEPRKKAMPQKSELLKFFFSSCGIAVAIFGIAWAVRTILEILASIEWRP